MENKEVIIIGAGAAGVGMGVALKDFGINNFAILERKQIGNSFIKWPEETRFITPSFTSNGFGMPDLNAIAIDTSPSYTLGKERLSGKDYAKYLQLVSEEYKLPIKTNCKVQSIKKEKTGYLLETTKGIIHAEYIIFAMESSLFRINLVLKVLIRIVYIMARLILGLKLKGISRQLSEEMRVRLMQLLN